MMSSANNWMNKNRLHTPTNKPVDLISEMHNHDGKVWAQSVLQWGRKIFSIVLSFTTQTCPSNLSTSIFTLYNSQAQHILHHCHHIHPITPSTYAISRICQHQPHPPPHVDFQGSLQPRKSNHHIQDGFLTSQERFWFIPYQPKEQPFGRWQPKERFCYRQV